MGSQTNFNIYKPIAELTNRDETEVVLYNLLRELHDGHIILYTQDGFPINPNVSNRAEKAIKAYNQELIRKYMINDFQYALENTIEYSFVSNKIGYMKMSKMYLTFLEGYATKEFDRV